MKYLKLFEKTYNGKYWLIPTDENRYYPSLKQIDCDDDFARKLAFGVEGTNSRSYRFIFVGCRDNKYWGWMSFKEGQTNLLEEEYYEINEYEFMGPVNIEEWELDSMKYNL